MDATYAAKLEQAAHAMDDAFPQMLFEPLMNDFGDLYFRIDIEDYGQEAVQADPRFTRRNIARMRGSTKRVDKYLEWVALYDDYMDYLVGKYGSYDMAVELEEAGALKDPLPSFNHRPILRRAKARRMLKQGIVPSFAPYGISEADCMEYVKKLCDMEEEPAHDEEPDIDWALNHKMSKKERELLQRTTDKYRRMHRREILLNGGSVSGIGSNMNFIDNYYANVSRGVYDTEFTDHDKIGDSLVAQMARMETRKFRHEGQIAAEEDEAKGGKIFYDGTCLRDKSKAAELELYQQMVTYLGVDILGTMTSKGVAKSRVKAIRTGMASLGYDPGLSEKDQKKLRKKQKKLDKHANKALRADQRLAEVLLNNKICVNGGTVRFEDMKRVKRREDDEY